MSGHFTDQSGERCPFVARAMPQTAASMTSVSTTGTTQLEVGAGSGAGADPASPVPCAGTGGGTRQAAAAHASARTPRRRMYGLRVKPSTPRRGNHARRYAGRASKTRLNGVSVALRNFGKPASRATAEIRASPACAPSAIPWKASEFGTQIIVDAA